MLSLEEANSVFPIAWSLPSPELSGIFVRRAVKGWRIGSRARSCRDISCRRRCRCGCLMNITTSAACSAVEAGHVLLGRCAA